MLLAVLPRSAYYVVFLPLTLAVADPWFHCPRFESQYVEGANMDVRALLEVEST